MKLPDNFQMREHSWPCRFHINLSYSIGSLRMAITNPTTQFQREELLMLDYLPFTIKINEKNLPVPINENYHANKKWIFFLCQIISPSYFFFYKMYLIMKIIMQEKKIFFFMLDYLPFIIEINEKMYPSMKIIMQKEEEGFSFYINDQQC